MLLAVLRHRRHSKRQLVALARRGAGLATIWTTRMAHAKAAMMAVAARSAQRLWSSAGRDAACSAVGYCMR